MNVPEEVRDELVEAVYEADTMIGRMSRPDCERAVDTILSRLEQVGWHSPWAINWSVALHPEHWVESDVPVYRFKKP